MLTVIVNTSIFIGVFTDLKINYRNIKIVVNRIELEVCMGEKIYKTMKSVGSFNLVMGILLIISGITTGVLFIAKGARLLKDKSELMF